MGLVLNFKAGLKFNIAACFSPFCFSSNFSCWKSIKQKHDYGLFGPTGGSTHAFFPLGLNRKIYLGCWYFFALHPRKHLCVPSSLKWSKVRLVLFFFFYCQITLHMGEIHKGWMTASRGSDDSDYGEDDDDVVGAIQWIVGWSPSATADGWVSARVSRTNNCCAAVEASPIATPWLNDGNLISQMANNLRLMKMHSICASPSHLEQIAVCCKDILGVGLC